MLIILLAWSFADLQNPQLDLDGKACAAVGQSGLMAIYDTLFSQVGLLTVVLSFVVVVVVEVNGFWHQTYLTAAWCDIVSASCYRSWFPGSKFWAPASWDWILFKVKPAKPEIATILISFAIYSWEDSPLLLSLWLLLPIIKIIFFYALVKLGGKCCGKAEAFVVVLFLIMALKAQKHRFGQVLSM